MTEHDVIKKKKKAVEIKGNQDNVHLSQNIFLSYIRCAYTKV